MSQAVLKIDLDAVAANWRALDAASASAVETGAVVKADAYGLGVARVARRLAREGARRFFVATVEEGADLRTALGPGPEINVFAGHMRGDADMIRDMDLVPMLNSVDQMLRHVESLPRHAFGIQLDSGMNRLGMEPGEWAALRDIALGQSPRLIMSHLACADAPDDAMNMRQLDSFREMTAGCGVPLSLAATGGILLGERYHFDVTRPGIGLYGGAPFTDARAVVRLEVPVIQCRDVAAGESVGYAHGWVAPVDARVATIAAGYADGLLRAAGAGGIQAYAGDIACPVVGRISMDLITVDVSALPQDPVTLSLLTAEQGVDALAAAAGTIGYEVLTSLGARYRRSYAGA